MGSSKVVKNLIIKSKENVVLKPFIWLLIGLYVGFYYVFVLFLKNKRKIVGLVLCSLFFISTSSFSNPIVFADNPEIKEEIIPEKVEMIGEDGTVQIEEVDISTLMATEEDLRALYEENAQKLLSDRENKMESDESVMIYEDGKGYIPATFEDDWSLILVNKKHLIPDDYEFELGTIRGNIKCDIRVLESVLDMIKAARDEGVILSICSPYRDNDRQVMLFNRKAASYMRRGYSEEEAYELASETVAIPGTSEHQIGLAFDFISNDYASLDAGFANTNAGKWLYENAADYGFILRYPEDKVDITEIEFEPWHYRYVGATAHEIMDNGLCLEEYASQIGIVD